MFEKLETALKRFLAIGLIFLMLLPAPTGASGGGSWGAGPRAVIDNSENLIIPAGEVYELCGCHTYSNSVQINGTLKVKPYDGSNTSTGMVWLKARWIIVGSTGAIVADGRGYGGGGGASERAGAGGSGGSGGKGGAGDMSRKDGGGGGGSNGGAGGAGGTQGTAGEPGTEAGGGRGGNSVTGGYQGGAGGSGFGGGGGGGAGFFDPSGTVAGGDGGGGGGGGCGGSPGNGYSTGGNGAGPAGGKGGQAQGQTPADGNDGGYMVAGANGDKTNDTSIVMGSGGGGGSSNLGGASLKSGWGGGGGGGAGGGAAALVSDGDILVAGSVSTTGGGGGMGGADISGTGGRGGGGAGGGVLLWGQKVTVTGSIDARGRIKNTLSTTNGGTVKIFCAEDRSGSGTIQAGRKYTNLRPPAPGLLEPGDNTAGPVRPVFRWEAVADPEGEPVTYQLQVSRSPEFGTLEVDISGIPSTEHEVAKELLGGPFYWRVRASDGWGSGPWSETWKLLSDTTPPLSRVNKLREFSNSVSFTVSWSGTDDSSGIDRYYIFVSEDGGPFGVWLDGTNATSGVYEGEDGHSYSFYSIAVDRSGNREATKSEPEASTTVDATPPTSRVAPLEPFQCCATIRVSWSGEDAVSGIKSYDIYSAVDGGSFEIWLRGAKNTSADFTGEDGHAYAFYSIATDRAGNVQEPPEERDIVRVRVDMTAPKSSVRFGNPKYGQMPVYIRPDTLINITACDGYSGVERTFYRIDERTQEEYTGSITEGAGGHHNLTYWSVDLAGNREEPAAVWFFVDGDAPITSLEFNGPNYMGEDAVYITSRTEISLVAKDGGVGVERTEYSLQEGGMDPFTDPIKMTKSGAHTLRYRSVDYLLNEEKEKRQRLVVDNEPPKTTAVAPSGPQRTDITIELTAQDALSGVAATYYRIDPSGGPEEGWVCGTVVRIPAPEDHTNDGRHRVEYYSVDNLGNREPAASLEVEVDTRSLLELEELSPKGDRVVIRGRAEPGAVVKINGERVDVRADGSFEREFKLQEGKNTFVVSSTDPAGNEAELTRSVSYSRPAEGLQTGAVVGAVAAVALVAAALAAVVMMRRKKKGSVEKEGAAPPSP
ncbi:MAG: hypothetical protein QXD84_08475 [Thermoplasmata archaeon]